MKTFSGRVAVITGAAEGIGKAIALHAARQGMKLVLADLNPDTLSRTMSELVAEGAEVTGLDVDVSDTTRVEALADLAYSRFGAVHLLVNNAGVALAKSVWETSQKDWDWVMGVNLYGVTNGLRAFVPRMLAGGDEGHIVNVASVAGLISEPGMAAYNASKFGVVTVSEGLFHDLALRQAPIGVSVLCPAWVRTRIAEAERHRAATDRTDFTRLDPHTLSTGQAMMKAVRNGIAAEDVADKTFAAIRDNRFYVLTHEQSVLGVKIRMQDIVDNRPPTLLPI